MTETKKSVEEIKIEGNECVKDGKFIEAVLHYTQALKMDPSNYVLYSNRSFAFLKLDQHYLSLQDANETVRLQPQWAKGYFRRAEVEAASGLYDEAILSYTRALQFEPHNAKLLESIKELNQLQRQRIISNRNTIWISACIGLVLGIGIVIADYLLTEKPTISHPISMIAFSLAIAGGGWGIGKAIILIRNYSIGKSLTPPEDLETNSTTAEENVAPEKKQTKYSKAQARQRYKQGKL